MAPARRSLADVKDLARCKSASRFLHSEGGKDDLGAAWGGVAPMAPRDRYQNGTWMLQVILGTQMPNCVKRALPPLGARTADDETRTG